MSQRLNYGSVAPDAIRALIHVNDYISDSSISPRLRYLAEVRTSQINGCGYCIQVHWRQALDAGENEARLDALEDWRDSNLFTERERAALAWVEDVTRIAESRAPDASYAALHEHFNDREIVDLTFIVMSMNAWNRLAISFRREAL